MTIRSTIAIMLTVASVAFTAPVQATAQDGVDVPEIAAEDVTAGQIVSFVNAMIALERVRIDFQQKMEAAETEEERKALAEEADEVGIQVVDAVVGITPGEYIAIIKAAENSDDLTARIEARVDELRKKQQGKSTTGAETPKAEE